MAGSRRHRPAVPAFLGSIARAATGAAFSQGREHYCATCIFRQGNGGRSCCFIAASVMYESRKRSTAAATEWPACGPAARTAPDQRRSGARLSVFFEGSTSVGTLSACACCLAARCAAHACAAFCHGVLDGMVPPFPLTERASIWGVASRSGAAGGRSLRTARWSPRVPKTRCSPRQNLTFDLTASRQVIGSGVPRKTALLRCGQKQGRQPTWGIAAQSQLRQ